MQFQDQADDDALSQLKRDFSHRPVGDSMVAQDRLCRLAGTLERWFQRLLPLGDLELLEKDSSGATYQLIGVGRPRSVDPYVGQDRVVLRDRTSNTLIALDPLFKMAVDGSEVMMFLWRLDRQTAVHQGSYPGIREESDDQLAIPWLTRFVESEPEEDTARGLTIPK